jgi:hypothetical protein
MKTEYQVFTYNGEQYRAMLVGGMLKALCHRKSIYGAWRKIGDDKAKELLKGIVNEQPKLRACV